MDIKIKDIEQYIKNVNDVNIINIMYTYIEQIAAMESVH